MIRFRRVPNYLWTFAALIVGVVAGGLFPGRLALVSDFTGALIRGIVALVPVLIFVALSPAVATLVRRGLAGRFAGAVVGWYLVSSAVAGLFGLVVSSVLFGIPFTADGRTAGSEAVTMIRALGEQAGTSLPLFAILGAVPLGVAAAWSDRLYAGLARVERGVHRLGHGIGYVMVPLIFLFGITLGVRFGARLGVGHYLTMTLYTAALCLGWWLVYLAVAVKGIARRRAKPVVVDYYLPTAIFAAGTCSSLATLPVNLANVKRVGVRDEVADFVIPFGAIANLDASALMYVAYAPFVLGHVFGLTISWTTLLVAWPAIVVFTVAAPGLPAGMGTALWSATLFASMLGLADPMRSDFITTWIALSGGLPDMFRTATNCTGDGFTAIAFDGVFGRFRPGRSGG